MLVPPIPPLLRQHTPRHDAQRKQPPDEESHPTPTTITNPSHHASLPSAFPLL